MFRISTWVDEKRHVSPQHQGPSLNEVYAGPSETYIPARSSSCQCRLHAPLKASTSFVVYSLAAIANMTWSGNCSNTIACCSGGGIWSANAFTNPWLILWTPISIQLSLAQSPVSLYLHFNAIRQNSHAKQHQRYSIATSSLSTHAHLIVKINSIPWCIMVVNKCQQASKHLANVTRRKLSAKYSLQMWLEKMDISGSSFVTYHHRV